MKQSHITHNPNEIRFAPRNRCAEYFDEKRRIGILTTLEQFKEFKKQGFSYGPVIDVFGGGNDPHNPNRQAFGRLNSGELIYCELERNKNLNNQ